MGSFVAGLVKELASRFFKRAASHWAVAGARDGDGMKYGDADVSLL